MKGNEPNFAWDVKEKFSPSYGGFRGQAIPGK